MSAASTGATSWRPEVFVDGRWSTNQLRFATKEEAEANARDLLARWKLTERSRAHVSDCPPRHVLRDGKVLRLDE